jgi:tetratricopeptide (TPR) repeat protein
MRTDAIKRILRRLFGRGGGRMTQIGQATGLARASLGRAPHDVEQHIERATSLRKSNDLEGARRELEAARVIAPNNHRVLRHLGNVESRLDNHEAAEAHLRNAIAAKPKDLRCHLDLARCVLSQKRFADAAQILRDATQTFPNRAEVYALLGHVLRWCGEHREALEHLARAVELEPDKALAMVEIAQIREEIGEYEPALELHRRAAEARRDPSYNATIFCHALLAAGRGREAWAANMNRVEYQALRTLPGVRVWDGEPLAGKSIMVVNEGGTGDQIRDACTFGELIAAAERVTVVCEPRLAPLFQRSFPHARFLGVKHKQRVADYERMLSKLIDDDALAQMRQHDYCVLSPDLLYFFRGDDELWGRRESYLVPAPDLLERWRPRVAELGNGFKVGISWRSGALYYNRECFYTKLSDWGPILTLPGVQFVNVQYDESEAEVRAAEQAFGIRIHRWDDLNLKDDFDGVSALVRQLDLVLAPNTTVLELAGALGVPGRYMIRVPIAYDHWRRKDGTDQDRIYPSVRQVRGDRPWDPHSLIANTAAMIRDEMRKAT